MGLVPDLPSRHVWVHTHGSYAAPSPGIVALWLPQPGTETWRCLVAVQRTPASVSVVWVPAELLDPIPDPTPAGSWTGRRGTRHAWRGPLYDGGRPSPALVLDTRRDGGKWQAQIAAVDTHQGDVLIRWESPDQIRPVTDDTAPRRTPGSV
ncbi:hypothetical protein GCM10028864_27070 [Microlunatus parietis]